MSIVLSERKNIFDEIKIMSTSIIGEKYVFSVIRYKNGNALLRFKLELLD